MILYLIGLCLFLEFVYHLWITSETFVTLYHLIMFEECIILYIYIYILVSNSLYTFHSSAYRCSWKCVHYMKLFTGEIFHVWLQFCSPLFVWWWCFTQWILECSFQWLVVGLFTDHFVVSVLMKVLRSFQHLFLSLKTVSWTSVRA